MPLVLKELASSDATNRRNAAFCVGELCRNGGDGTLKYPLSPYSTFHCSFSRFGIFCALDFVLCPVNDMECHVMSHLNVKNFLAFH